MATNDILPFCPTDTGTNLLTESEYNLSADRVSGNKPGVASSKLNNKAIRQSAFISSQFAQYISDRTGSNVLDDANTAALLAIITAALAAPTQPDGCNNLGLACSVGASALTIALKQADGATNPSTGAAATEISFRSATATSGAYNKRSVTGALSLVVSSGSTLGLVSGVTGYLYVYAIDNAGTVELAVSGQRLADEGSLQSTTAEGGAGAADSGVVLYSTTARANVPVRLLARLLTSQVTAGTWAAVPTEIALNFEKTPHFRISGYLNPGTRVTGTAPVALGEYRSYLRNVSANTYTETNGSPTAAPSAADGVKIYRNTAWGVVNSNNSPTKYEVFIGKNKQYQMLFFSSAAFANPVTTDFYFISTEARGIVTMYDPNSGILTVVCPSNSSSTSTPDNYITANGASGGSDIFFDVIVSDL